ncbi:MAG: aminoglycoside phosphotransferase family protein [Acidobacteriota bacterium]
MKLVILQRAGFFRTIYAVSIPANLVERIERVHGVAGRTWLRTLPALLAECSTRWSLELEEPFANLSYNLVVPGKAACIPTGVGARTEIVLKLGVPCAELRTEAQALELIQGSGAVILLDLDMRRGAMLLERVIPGTPLYLFQNQDAAGMTRTAAAVMRRLWRTPPPSHSLPSLTVWFRAFARLRGIYAGGSGPFPARIIDTAERMFAELNASAETEVVLHGDLHHDNILFGADRGWLAIDPKGLVGDPGYEVGSFMLNQLPRGATETQTMQVLTRRLAIFSEELGIARERLARWAFCHAVLSAVWDLEEAADWRVTIRLAEMLERLG